MKIFFTMLLISASIIATAQPSNWSWAKGAGGSLEDYGNAVACDNSGNIYLVGQFRSPVITFGSTTLTTSNPAQFYDDGFVVKYDANGNVLWAKQIGGMNFERAVSVTVDLFGNIYVTGIFTSSTITIGSFTLSKNNPSNQNVADLFVAKYDSNGNVIWAKSAGGANDDYAKCVSTDATGNIYITGYFDSPSIVFGSTTLNNANGSNFPYTKDLFIVKYNSSGSVLWAKKSGDLSDDIASSVAIDASGNIYTTGYFSSSSITFGSTILTNANTNNSNDIFIAKYDSNGNNLWAKSAGSSSDDASYSISTYSNNDIYIAGRFLSTSLTFGSNSLTNNGQYDAFIAKYDNTGNVIWAKSVGGVSGDKSNTVTTDATGNCYLGGDFISTTIVFGSTTFTNAGGMDLFLAKYDGNGNPLWAQTAVGINNQSVNSIVTDASNNIYTTGWYQNDAITFNPTTLTNIGREDVFTAKLDATTGINENPIHNYTTTIFPNPFSSSTILQIDQFLKNASLTIYNSFGQTVKQIDNLAGQTIVFHRGNLPSGLYFVRLTQDSKTISADKFVIVDE